MTFEEMYGEELSKKIGTTDTTQRFTTVRRKAAVNKGLRKFNEKTHCYKVVVSIALADGTGEYDLETAGVISGENFLIPASEGPSLAITTIADSSVRYQEGDSLPFVSEDALNAQEQGWRAWAAGVPRYGYYRQATGAHYVGLTPPPDIPATETWALRFPYIAIPPTLTATSDIPYSGRIALFPYHEAAVEYAASEMEELRKNYEQADRRMAKFAAYVVSYRQDQAPIGGSTIRLKTNPRRVRMPWATSWASQ